MAREWWPSSTAGSSSGTVIGAAATGPMVRCPSRWARITLPASETMSAAGSPMAQPSSQASLAPIGRPVRRSSAARSRPMSRGSLCVPPNPGMIPS